jgi:tetratricopeptide (TPR) repeat protein
MRFGKCLLPWLGVVLWFGIAPVWAQEEETPEQKQYRADYDLYQKIKAVAEPWKRADQLLQFLRERPNSKLLANVQSDYILFVQDLSKQAKWDAVVAQADRFIRLRPRVGEAYYLLGSALKELKKNAEAMDALAKCYVLRCPVSEKARQYLEYIYKGANRGSTAGLDAIIKKARSELGG